MQTAIHARLMPLPLPGARVLIPAPEGEPYPLPRMLTQIHSDRVVCADSIGSAPTQGDAIYTLVPDECVGVCTADCVPIVLRAPDIGAVAAIHAGWRGTIAEIAARAVGRLAALGADPALMQAAFGPSVCGSCYTVSPELARTFANAGYASVVGESRQNPTIDLQKANRLQLEKAGLPPESVLDCPVCTLHHPDKLPSWRRSPGTTERLITLINNTI